MDIFFSPQATRAAMTEIPIFSPLYPAALKELSSPPPCLYAIGDTSLLQTEKFVVVGSRKTPINALKLGTEISKALSKHFTLLTGTADGGDSAAIEGALAGSGKIICLLAGGFSALPQSKLALLERVAKRGLLLAAAPFDTPVRAFSYEARNRMLAKCSVGVLVLGAGEKSGALITARYAKQYQKPIFALPYPPNSASGCGCNELIKGGGFLTEGAEDITAAYGIVEEREEERIVLTNEEEGAYRALKEKGETHINELSADCNVPAYKLRGVLAALEVKGLVVSLGGNRYAAIK